MKQVGLLLFILFSSIQAWCTGNCDPLHNNSSRYCIDNQIISASGAQIVVYSNGGLSATFEELVAGAPTSVSVVIQGCSVSGTICDTLDTNTTVGNSLRSPIISKTYYSYVITAAWTGGTNPTVTVNTQQTTPRLRMLGGSAPTVGAISYAWLTQDGFGLTAKDTLNGNNATLSNVVWAGTTAPLTNALVLDGATSYGQVANAINYGAAQAFSVVAWVKIGAANSAGYPIIANFNDGNYNGWDFALQEHSDTLMHLNFYIGNNYTNNAIATYSSNTCVIPTNSTLHQVAATYDGSSKAAGVNFYVDGTACAGANIVGTDTLTAAVSSTFPPFIGRQCIVSACSPVFFSGTIGDLMVTNKVLSPTAIAGLFNSPYNINWLR